MMMLAAVFCTCGAVMAQNFGEAKAIYADGDYAKAKAAFARLVRTSPANASYNYWHGLACLKTHDYAGARKSLEKAAKRKYADAAFVLGRVNTILYDFDEAVADFEDYSEQLAKGKGAAAEVSRLDRALAQARAARMMMMGVEKVNVIDSVVIDKDDLLSIYRLPASAGKLQTYSACFGTEPDSADMRTAYVTEMGNVMLYSDHHDSGMALYRSQKGDESWSAGKMLPAVINSGLRQSYPYLLSDGMTIYYASDCDESIGGYDIFVTAYSTQDDAYMRPQNIGMPFNSPFNDYMYAIDEENNLGWFASDRYQPEGKVCVYVFVPNDSKVVYDPGITDADVLRHAATLVGFHAVQPSPEVAAAGMERLQEVFAGQPESGRRTDFVFIIDDDRTYTNIYDFMSKDAQDMFVRRQKLDADRRAMQSKLDAMRARFHSAAQPERDKMRASVIDTECRVLEMEAQVADLDVQIRNAEIRKLRDLNL